MYVCALFFLFNCKQKKCKRKKSYAKEKGGWLATKGWMGCLVMKEKAKKKAWLSIKISLLSQAPTALAMGLLGHKIAAMK
jgi:hypothetical protein